MEFWTEAFAAIVHAVWDEFLFIHFWLVAGLGFLAGAAVLVWWGRQPAQLGGPWETKAYCLAAVCGLCGAAMIWRWWKDD